MRDAISRLQESETDLEIASPPDDGSPAWTFGVDDVDASLPPAGMSRTGLHEIEPLRPVDMPFLTGFAFGLLARLRSQLPVIWCVSASQAGDSGHLYAFGLQRYGVSPGQIVFARVSKTRHLHFAMEEALKTDGVAAVIGEGPQPDFTGSRRLSLLCEKHRTPCLLMNPVSNGGKGSAALIRWQIAPLPGIEDPLDPYGPGLPTWQVALARARGGRAMPPVDTTPLRHGASYPWRIVWDEQTLSFRPASVFSGGTLSERTEPQPASLRALGG